jgi:hypothetical protein
MADVKRKSINLNKNNPSSIVQPGGFLLQKSSILIYKKVGDRLVKNINQEVVSFSANKTWLAIPVKIRRELERNVWCSNCSDVVQIIDFSVKDSPPGIVLEGKCKNCGKDVARFIE